MNGTSELPRHADANRRVSSTEITDLETVDAIIAGELLWKCRFEGPVVGFYIEACGAAVVRT